MLYAESILSEVPSINADFCRVFMDSSNFYQSSLRGSVVPASIMGSTTGSVLENNRFRYAVSPTITECPNEPQMESKFQMRQKISKLGPKLVSPKRTLGTGPVLIGKLDPVTEVKEFQNLAMSLSLNSSSTHASMPDRIGNNPGSSVEHLTTSNDSMSSTSATMRNKTVKTLNTVWNTWKMSFFGKVSNLR